MTHILVTGLGGAFGAISRVLLAQVLPGTLFGIPLQILIINVLGCFMMGAITEMLTLFTSLSIHARAFLISGFLGGFTTFSAFALDFGLLYARNNYNAAIFYALSSVLLSLLFFFAGLKLVKIFT